MTDDIGFVPRVIIVLLKLLILGKELNKLLLFYMLSAQKGILPWIAGCPEADGIGINDGCKDEVVICVPVVKMEKIELWMKNRIFFLEICK